MIDFSPESEKLINKKINSNSPVLMGILNNMNKTGKLSDI